MTDVSKPGTDSSTARVDSSTGGDSGIVNFRRDGREFDPDPKPSIFDPSLRSTGDKSGVTFRKDMVDDSKTPGAKTSGTDIAKDAGRKLSESMDWKKIAIFAGIAYVVWKFVLKK